MAHPVLLIILAAKLVSLKEIKGFIQSRGDIDQKIRSYLVAGIFSAVDAFTRQFGSTGYAIGDVAISILLK